VELSLNKLELNKITDFIAFSFLYCARNFNFIFKQILVPQFISIGVIYFLYKSFYGEFNLTYFLSTEGKVFMALFILSLILNIYNTIYISIKLIVFNKLEFKSWRFRILLFVITTVRFFLFIVMMASIYFDYTFILMFFTFLILNTYFYQFIFDEAEKTFSGSQSNRKFFENLKINTRAFLISIFSRTLTIFLPFLATFSIFIVYEFVRILITGKVFFFVIDRLVEFQFWFIFTLLLFLIANPFQYFTMMLFHKYVFLKEFNKNIKPNG